MRKIPLSIKSLSPLFIHKLGDKIHYKTPRGKVKILIYGKQTWYRRATPKGVIATLRGKTWFREPTINEIMSRYVQKRNKLIASAIINDNPLLLAFMRHVTISALIDSDSGRLK